MQIDFSSNIFLWLPIYFSILTINMPTDMFELYDEHRAKIITRYTVKITQIHAQNLITTKV